MNSDETDRKIADLERRVRELEAQPREQHFHYHPPVYVQPYTPPAQPSVPVNPPWRAPWVIGDPPCWRPTTIDPWLPDSNGTITWSGGNQ